MRSAALSIGWELWARHRFGVSAIGALVLVMALLVQVLPSDAAGWVGDVAQGLGLLAFLYLLSIFVYADGALAGRSAGFPRRLFTLPLRTSVLVAWPMLYGTVAAALLWLGLACLILVPSGRSPGVVWWPAFFQAACLACFQAVCWTLVRTPLLRLVVAILGLPSIGLSIVLVWATYDLHVTIVQVNLGLCAVIGVAYAVAVAGVRHDRRGDGSPWVWLHRLLPRAIPRWPASERPFSSAMAAQLWLEVRRQGWLLPASVGLFLAMLFWATALPLSPTDVQRVAAALLVVPCLVAFFIGFGMGKTSFWARDLHLSSFSASRPITSAALANAKFYAAGLSALATWGLILLFVPLWAVASGNVGVLRELGHALFHDQSEWKLGLLAPVALAGLVGLTWLQLAAGMCLSLTGRASVVNGVVLLYFSVGAALIGLRTWIGSNAEFFDALPIVLWSLGLLKLGAAAWTLRRLGRWRDRTIAKLALWLTIAACLQVPLYAVVPAGVIPRNLLALLLVLALPLTRVLALPAAVTWNRHR